ncbi:MAG: SAM-dependent chlorinase/fluorinase, partial [Planctomycetes bacterium]|nr:SAM-dependent chlorinase/fluorinase [Planctomycetota bacterium]
MSDAAFEANGVVTLLTDFGLTDPYVGVMKGVMLSSDPKLELIDLTHGVPPQA